jgi:hypothetical protein
MKWDAERLAVAQAIATELERVRTVEQTLRTNLTKQRKEHKYESDRLAIQYESALTRLSDRPDRPDSGGVPEGSDTGTGPATGCTGAQLSRPDAAVLVGIARDADRLQLALDACQAAYDSVRQALNPTQE